LKKARIFFLCIVFFLIFLLQSVFFVFITKINNLNKILNIKNTLYKIILHSNNIENEFKGFRINNDSFLLSIPSIDINKTFISNYKDIVIITKDKSSVSFTLYPCEFSIRKNKVVRFLNVKSVKITDCGYINFLCNINGEVVESDFYINRDVWLLPDDFKVF